MSDLVFSTERLDLVAGTVDHLWIELDAPERLGEMLGAEVPPGWPPGAYDRDAITFFLEKLNEGGPAVAGWYGWYAIRRAPAVAPSTDEASTPPLKRDDTPPQDGAGTPPLKKDGTPSQDGADTPSLKAALVGTIGYFGPPSADGVVEIGYSVAASHRERGYATEMVRAMTARALATQGVTSVVAEAHEFNVASLKVLERAGFVKVGAGRDPGHLRLRFSGAIETLFPGGPPAQHSR